MIRKDCENAGRIDARTGGTRSPRPPRARGAAMVAAVAVTWIGILPASVSAGVVRVHASAVVTQSSIRLDDVCTFEGFDAKTATRLGALTVGESPIAGGSRFVALDAIRAVLTGGGVHPAQVTIRGATQCAVSRPSETIPQPAAQAVSKPAPSTKHPSSSNEKLVSAGVDGNKESLRQAVIEHFNKEFSRYGGSAEVVFDHTSDQVLELSGPAYAFRVRPKQAQLLGLCPLEVDVLAGGRVVQTVPLVVQTTMTRHVVVAKRTINQDATVQAADVSVAALTFTKLDELGVADPAQVVGQRAKRVIPAGALVEMAGLESVPLVLRGQLVTITSEVAGIRVVTTGKAAQDGRRGEVIKVRSVDDKKVEFDAVVVAPGKVRLGSDGGDDGDMRFALGATP